MMKLSQSTANKKPKIYYFEYQMHNSEPKINRPFDITPELERELVESDYFLKRRVRRNIKKARRQYRETTHEHNHGRPQSDKDWPNTHTASAQVLKFY